MRATMIQSGHMTSGPCTGTTLIDEFRRKDGSDRAPSVKELFSMIKDQTTPPVVVSGIRWHQ